jgi:hypothetical protein
LPIVSRLRCPTERRTDVGLDEERHDEQHPPEEPARLFDPGPKPGLEDGGPLDLADGVRIGRRTWVLWHAATGKRIVVKPDRTPPGART